MLRRSALLRDWLARRSVPTLNVYAVAAGFATYFCMYAFRKPFSAATYDAMTTSVLGFTLELKTTLVVSQITGYATSKFLGIKFCSEASRWQRPWLLVGLVIAAELALVLFAVVPPQWKAAALFLNGLPLGMVWGLVVQYLEGRRTSEFLLAGLSCSFIVSSGVVKDVGRTLMAPAADDASQLIASLRPIPEFWMPAATGALFLPLFLLSVWLLDHLPEPTAQDIAERTERQPMNAARRSEFLRAFLPGIVFLVVSYVLLTAFRDFRDNFQADLLDEMGYSFAQYGSVISRMELLVMFAVMGTMASLSFVRDNRRGLFAVFGIMLAGAALVGGSTLLWKLDLLSGYWWMMLLGTGSYLAYVPYNSLLFDRLLASTRTVGTAVFAIYIADAFGYVGSVVVVLLQDVARGSGTRLNFFANLAFCTSAIGVVGMAAGCIYFARRSVPAPAPTPRDEGATTVTTTSTDFDLVAEH